MSSLRTYRHWVKGKDLVSFNVRVKETDLYIRATTSLKRRATRLVVKYREMLEGYIERHPPFLTSLQPIPVDDDAPGHGARDTDSRSSRRSFQRCELCFPTPASSQTVE